MTAERSRSKRPRIAKALRMTFRAFNRHDASQFGAALAFYIIFSIAPALLIAISVAGLLIGRPEAEREILDSIGSSFGSATADAIATMVKDVPRHAGWWATCVGIVTLYFGLAGVYRQIGSALRTIWSDKHDRRAADGAAPTVEKKIASVALIIALGVVVFLSVLADGAIAATGRYAQSRLLGGELLWQIVQLIVSTVTLTVLFGAVFRYLPQATVEWRDVRLGAAVTGVLFVIGKLALGLYLGKAAVGSAFGAAGSIVVVLLWSYWSAQILFFGLEFTHVYAQEREDPRHDERT
jgi:membrane protein